MKRLIAFVLAGAFTFAMNGISFAQNAPIDFESGGFGATWTWTVFENDTNPPLEIVANPSIGGINTSATVAEFTALQAGQPWAGCESMHGSDIGTFTLDASNSTVKIMVYKSVISDVGIKFVVNDGGSTGEIKVANTLINEWEELTFDFSGKIGEPTSTDIDQIVIFPDFDLGGRLSDNVVYFDNITFSEMMASPSPTDPAPVPTEPEANVISLYSNAYTNVPVDTWSASWDLADVTDTTIAGNDTKLYTNLVFAGIEFISQTIDAIDMTHFHMDIWTPDETASPAVFKIKLVDFGADGVFGGGDDVEQELTFDENSTPPLVTQDWVGFDIPLSDFTGLVTREHLAQLIISGDPNTVWVDNVYFYTESTGTTMTCEDISQYGARCNSSGAVQSIVKVLDGDFGGEILTWLVDGEPVEVTVISDGSRSVARMAVPHAGMGQHSIELVDPADCGYGVALVNCQVDAPPDPEWDALWNEYEAIAAAHAAKAMPMETKIIGNYPNPFNPSTTIRYALGVDSPVSVRVYNMLGQEVATLVDGFQKAGEQSVAWHGVNNFGQAVASGLYFYRIQTGNTVMTQKMLFTK